MRNDAVLVLEDGRAFRGESYGAVGETFGEAVFATGMTGYQETLTDPSYHRQIVAMTSPHIGNTGWNDEDDESSRIWASGFVGRAGFESADPSRIGSNWRATGGFEAELLQQGIVGITGVDTRALTRHVRERGAMRAGISSLNSDVNALLEKVLASPSMAGADLVGDVSCTEPIVTPAVGEKQFTVAALDLGIKRNTPRRMSARGMEVHTLPYDSTMEDILSVKPDGVFLSNGPGDPATALHAIALTQQILEKRIPLFGICFGNQILGRALGFDTYKLRYGHRGINLPVRDNTTGRVEITAHNHGFAVCLPHCEHEESAVRMRDGKREDSAVRLPHDPVFFKNGVTRAEITPFSKKTGQEPVSTPYGRVEVSHVCLNDNVIEGLRCLDVPAFSVQYHPEAAAGPHDADYLFDRFAELMEGKKLPGKSGEASTERRAQNA